MPDRWEPPPHLREFATFLEHLKTESERGEVLISAAVIDDLLARTLAAFLVQGSSADSLLSGFNAPLGSFSARIAACAALGLIHPAEHHDAEQIRKIRNDFAHNLKASFGCDSIKARCIALQLSAKDHECVTVSTRGQFSTAATGLILNLTNRPHYVGKKRLTPQLWPY